MNDCEFMGEERRRFVRLERSLLVKFALAGDVGSKVYTAITSNISQRGLCMEFIIDAQELVPRLKVRETLVNVTLKLEEDADPIQLRARVEWLQELSPGSGAWSIGLSFQNLASVTNERIRAFILRSFTEGQGKIRNY
jgi:hypothetical protein